MKENNTYRNNTGDPKLPKSLVVNPFTLPENYFKYLERETLFKIKLDESPRNNQGGFTVPKDFFKRQESDIQQQLKLGDHRGKTDFIVPDGYFQKSANQIFAQTRIPDGRTTAPNLPTDYFETLSTRIIDRIENGKIESQLPSISNTGFTSPDRYFQSSAEEIMASAVSDSLKSKVSHDGFTVPDHYFDSLSNSIAEQSINPKVISITPEDTSASQPHTRNKTKLYSWLGSIAAASVVLILGVNFYQSNDSNEGLVHQDMTLHDIPEEEIINYISNNSDPSDLDYYVEYIYQLEESKEVGAGIDADELEDYLNYTL